MSGPKLAEKYRVESTRTIDKILHRRDCPQTSTLVVKLWSEVLAFGSASPSTLRRQTDWSRHVGIPYQ